MFLVANEFAANKLCCLATSVAANTCGVIVCDFCNKSMFSKMLIVFVVVNQSAIFFV
jgi:hypothetical protein